MFLYFQLGYYSSKGLHIISKSLYSIFLKINILIIDNCYPQSLHDYINNVLVPKTVTKLISEDYGRISLNEANKIMNDSVNFRLYIHDIDSIY